jgi:hypothetical protein
MDTTTQQQAAELIVKHRDSIDYFLKFGSSIERAMAQVILDVAGEQ